MIAVLYTPVLLHDGDSLQRDEPTAMRVPAGRYPLERVPNPREHLGPLHGAEWWVLQDTALGMAGGAWEHMAKIWPHLVQIER